MSLLYNRKNLIKNISGFTIVELVVVIVVILILTSIVIISYSNVTDDANNTVTKVEVSDAFEIIDTYYIKHNAYPVINISTGCPTDPVVDNIKCLKFSQGTSYTYNKTVSTFELVATNKDGKSYTVNEKGKISP